MIISDYCRIEEGLVKDINKAIEKDNKDKYSLTFKHLNKYTSIKEKPPGAIIDIQGTGIYVYTEDLIVYPHKHPISAKVESIDFMNTFMTEITEYYQQSFKNVIKNVKHLNFSGVTFSKTIKHLTLFSNLPSLESLDLSNAVITNMDSLCQAFINNENLKQINLKGLICNKQYMDLSFAFHNCSKLMNLDLSFLKGVHLLSVIGAFNSCENLEEIKGFNDTDISSCVTLEMLFFNCQKIKEISIPETNTKTLKSLAVAFSQNFSLKKLNIINNSNDKATNLSVSKIFMNSPKDIEININKPYNIEYSLPDFIDIDSINLETHISEKMFKQQVNITQDFLVELVANIGVLKAYHSNLLSLVVINMLYDKEYTLKLMQADSSYRTTFITKQQILSTGTFCYIYYPTFLLIIQANGLDDLTLTIISEKITIDIPESLACKLNMQTINL